MREKIKAIIVQLYYEEMHPIKDYTGEEMMNRKEKAIDEYLGRNQSVVSLPILHAKVDKAMFFIDQVLSDLKQEILKGVLSAEDINDFFYYRWFEERFY